MLMTLAEIAAVLGVKSPAGSNAVSISGISTDSREASLAGKLFIPLKGEHFDGHQYLAQAQEKGAVAVLTEREVTTTVPRLVVGDTLFALGTIAASWRHRFTIPLVGVTGSAGKTTTKEMIASILAAKGEGLKTQGNLNNLIGLPHTLLGLNTGHRWGVVELGMNRLREIERLTEIARPTIGIITNVGPAHLADLGSIANVARAKGELFTGLGSTATAAINMDDERIAALPLANGVRRIRYGRTPSADLTAEQILLDPRGRAAFILKTPSGSVPVRLSLSGDHQVPNALGAAAVALVAGCSPEEIAAGLARVELPGARMRIEEIAGVTLINDCYNANPISMAASLRTLGTMAVSGRRFALLGDMFELGADASELHRQAGYLAGGIVDRLCVVGTFAGDTARGALDAGLPAQAVTTGTKEELATMLRGELQEGDVLLIKGSRGMRLESVLATLFAVPAGRD